MGNPDYDKKAVAIMAGEELVEDVSCDATTVSQDRTTGNLNSYYEQENCDQDVDPDDDTYQRANLTDLFNDQIRIIN